MQESKKVGIKRRQQNHRIDTITHSLHNLSPKSPKSSGSNAYKELCNTPSMKYTQSDGDGGGVAEVRSCF